MDPLSEAILKALLKDPTMKSLTFSGTHWVWEIVRILLAQKTDLPVVEKDVAMLEDVFPEDIEVSL